MCKFTTPAYRLYASVSFGNINYVTNVIARYYTKIDPKNNTETFS